MCASCACIMHRITDLRACGIRENQSLAGCRDGREKISVFKLSGAEISFTFLKVSKP